MNSWQAAGEKQQKSNSKASVKLKQKRKQFQQLRNKLK